MQDFWIFESHKRWKLPNSRNYIWIYGTYQMLLFKFSNVDNILKIITYIKLFRHYEHQQKGTYYLYRNKAFPMEVKYDVELYFLIFMVKVYICWLLFKMLLMISNSKPANSFYRNNVRGGLTIRVNSVSAFIYIRSFLFVS